MSMRMELSDLPPKYRAQAEAQIAARCRAKAPTLEAVAAAAKKTGREFDSRGEYDYYMGMILPKVQRGEIVKVESHRRFTMLPEKEYGNTSRSFGRMSSSTKTTSTRELDMSAGNAAVYQMNTAGKSRGNTVSMLPPIPVQNPEAST